MPNSPTDTSPQPRNAGELSKRSDAFSLFTGLTDTGDKTLSTLVYITLVRCAYALLVLGYGVIWLNQRSTVFLDELQTKLFLWSVIEMFIFTSISCVALYLKRFIRAVTYTGMFHDALIAAVIVLLTDFGKSPFSYLFLIIPLYGGVTLKKRGGLIGAAFTTLMMAAIYVFIPKFLSVLPVSLRVLLNDLGVMDGDVLLRQFWALTLAAIGVGFLTGQLAHQYENAKASLVMNKREFAQFRGAYAKLLDALPKGIVAFSRDNSRSLYANNSAVQLLGERLDAPNLLDLLQPSDTALETSHWDIKMDLATLRVERFSFELDAMNRLEGYYLSDVTELIAAQQERFKRQRMEVLGEFSARIAHEIRNPLACISGCTEMLDADTPDAERTQILDMMTTEIDRLNGLLENILVFSRRPRLNPETLSLKSIVEQQKILFLGDPACKGMTIDVDIDPDCEFIADKTSLVQILMTLWRNAQEAVEGVGKILVHCQCNGHNTRLCVSDSGPGIPEERATHIFEPFFTSKANGTGLGLATAKQLASDNGLSLSWCPNETPPCFSLEQVQERSSLSDVE